MRPLRPWPLPRAVSGRSILCNFFNVLIYIYVFETRKPEMEVFEEKKTLVLKEKL